MNFREIQRADLIDAEGNILSLIVETNKESWKMFGRFQKLDQSTAEASISEVKTFTDSFSALKYFQERLNSVLTMGWEIVDQIPTEKGGNHDR